MASDSEPLDPIAAWRWMLLAHSRSLRAIERDLAARGAIPLTWYDVLLELHGADGPLRMQELGSRVVLSRTRVSRLVGELEGEGLVRRKPDPSDGRSTLVSLTASGARALRKAAPAYLSGIEQHFTSHLTKGQQRSIAAGLKQVVDAHQTETETRQ